LLAAATPETAGPQRPVVGKRAAWACGLLLGSFLATACKEPSKEVEANPSESPQAKVVPAPLTTESAPVSIGSVRPLVADAGEVPALRARPDRELAADTGGKDMGGFGGTWIVRPENAWSAPRSPDVAAGPLEALRRKLETKLAFETTASRARVALQGGTFLVPDGVELRFRNDVLGAILLAPGGSRYRVLPPGSLRTFFDEGRFDVVPLAVAKTAFEDLASAEGPKKPGDARRKNTTNARVSPRSGSDARLLVADLPLRRRTVTTDRGAVTLDVANLEGAGEGGVLLCRLFLDLVDASPDVAACGLNDLPVRVELHLAGETYDARKRARAGAKGIVFEATELVRRPDATPPPTLAGTKESRSENPNPSAFLAPPPNATLLREPLANGPGRLMASVADLEDLKGHRDPDSPGLTLKNNEGRPFVAWFEGIPIASVSPGESLVVPGLARGRYTLQFRTFLGNVVLPYSAAPVPGVASPSPMEGDAGGTQ
jgi:hypothetical protein